MACPKQPSYRYARLADGITFPRMSLLALPQQALVQSH